MKIIYSIVVIGLLYAPIAWSQCAPGIPSAGNPGCIPPDQPNSPYNNGNSTQQQAPQPRAVWADRWGAIALDANSGRAGTITGRTSKSEANQVALDLCERDGGQDCKILLAFHNQCAAATQNLGGGTIFAASAAGKDEAERSALDDCGGRKECKVVYSQCSYPERVQ
ncbi:DUF4189 domain-containing protein [Luteibacter rhizovicinus]|uniref:DUF4189 domain-containing protein n=1 Tax=Luteibacter rhizovicinus TaxID=242606 RepID=UPI00104EB2AA